MFLLFNQSLFKSSSVVMNTSSSGHTVACRLMTLCIYKYVPVLKTHRGFHVETVGNSTSHFNTSPVEKFTMCLVLIIDSNMFHHALSEVHSALGWLS